MLLPQLCPAMVGAIARNPCGEAPADVLFTSPPAVDREYLCFVSLEALGFKIWMMSRYSYLFFLAVVCRV